MEAARVVVEVRVVVAAGGSALQKQSVQPLSSWMVIMNASGLQRHVRETHVVVGALVAVVGAPVVVAT